MCVYVTYSLCVFLFFFFFFFFSSRRRHTRSVSAFLLNRSSDLACRPIMSIDVVEVVIWRESSVSGGSGAVQMFLRWQQRKPKTFGLLRFLLRLDRKSGSAGMPRPISYAVFCLKKKKTSTSILYNI